MELEGNFGQMHDLARTPLEGYMMYLCMSEPIKFLEPLPETSVEYLVFLDGFD